MDMNSNLKLSSDGVEFCKGDLCIRAVVENARILAIGISIFLGCMGIATVVSALKK